MKCVSSQTACGSSGRWDSCFHSVSTAQSLFAARTTNGVVCYDPYLNTTAHVRLNNDGGSINTHNVTLTIEYTPGDDSSKSHQAFYDFQLVEGDDYFAFCAGYCRWNDVPIISTYLYQEISNDLNGFTNITVEIVNATTAVGVYEINTFKYKLFCYDTPAPIIASNPTIIPSDEPSHSTNIPTFNPTLIPSSTSTTSTSPNPSKNPTHIPTAPPSKNPTGSPIYMTSEVEQNTTHVTTMIHETSQVTTTLTTNNPSYIPTEIPTDVNYNTTSIAIYSDNATSYSSTFDSMYSSSHSYGTTVNNMNTGTTVSNKDNSKQIGLTESGLLVAIGMICATLLCIFVFIIILAWRTKMAQNNKKHELQLERIRSQKIQSQLAAKNDKHNNNIIGDLSKLPNLQQATRHDTGGEIDNGAASGHENVAPMGEATGPEIVYQEKSLNDDDMHQQITNEGDNELVGMNQDRVQTKLIFFVTILIIDF